MHTSTSFLQPAIIQQLAATTNSLAATASRLYDLSTSLENHCAITNTPNPYIKSLDSFIETLQGALTQKLIPARVKLAKTRNRQVDSIMSLPPEILSWVFVNVVYDPYDEDYLFPVTMKMDTRICRIYQRVYTLIGVCKTWHQIGLACSDLWRLISLSTPEGGPWRKLATKLGLERAGNKSLQLAVASSLGRPRYELLTGYWHRLDTINIWCSSSDNILLNILNQIIVDGEAHSVSNLSINQTTPSTWPIWSSRGQQSQLSLHAQLSYLQPQFSELINSLSRLRISNVSLNWTRVNFSRSLVELYIINVKLYESSETADFLDMLSSAHEMRILSIDSVQILPEEDEDPPSTVSLPKLESLTLRGLSPSCIRLLLTCIVPGKCTTTLDLRGDVYTQSEEDSDFTGEDFALLRTIPIHRLIVSLGHKALLCDLRRLLMSMPNVRALTLHWYTLDAKLLEDLTVPITTNELFPRLETLEFYNSDCYSRLDDLWDAFRALLIGHPIRKMILGCSFFSPTSEYGESGSEDNDFASEGGDYEIEDGTLEIMTSNSESDDSDYVYESTESEVSEHDNPEDEPVIGWLRAIVPEFYLCSGSHHGPTGDTDWQLWDI